MREEGTGDRRRLHNEKLRDSYTLTDIKNKVESVSLQARGAQRFPGI